MDGDNIKYINVQLSTFAKWMLGELLTVSGCDMVHVHFV